GGTGEQDRTALALDHAPGDRLGGEEAGEAGHLPDLEVLARGFLEDAARHIGTDIEHKGFDRADITLDGLDQRRHFILLSRIGTKTVGLATGSTDFVQQRLQFVRLTPGYTGNVALAGKALGDFATSGIACAYHQ